MKKSIMVLGAMVMGVTALSAQVKGVTSLSERQQGIIQIAAFGANGNIDRLHAAIDEALDSGLTVNEAGEVFLQLYAYAGFPRSLNAQSALSEVVKEREAAGKNTVFGVAPSPVATENRYDIGREQLNEIFGRNTKQPRPDATDYATTTDVFLKEHLFADIIRRDNLNVRDRELATVSMLSALLTVNSQLTSHINGALTIGNSDQQLQDLVKVLNAKVGKKEARNAQSILNNVLESRKNPPAQTSSESASASVSTDNSGTVPNEARISAFDTGVENTAFAQYFIGTSYRARLSENQIPISNITFEPGCRNNWHIHHKSGQILIVTAGRGWYQEWGQPARELKAGDVVNISPEVKHWHGAAKDSWFAHLSLEVPAEGSSNEWLEEVSDAEYNSLK